MDASVTMIRLDDNGDDFNSTTSNSNNDNKFDIWMMSSPDRRALEDESEYETLASQLDALNLSSISHHKSSIIIGTAAVADNQHNDMENIENGVHNHYPPMSPHHEQYRCYEPSEISAAPTDDDVESSLYDFISQQQQQQPHFLHKNHDPEETPERPHSKSRGAPPEGLPLPDVKPSMALALPELSNDDIQSNVNNTKDKASLEASARDILDVDDDDDDKNHQVRIPNPWLSPVVEHSSAEVAANTSLLDDDDESDDDNDDDDDDDENENESGNSRIADPRGEARVKHPDSNDNNYDVVATPLVTATLLESPSHDLPANTSPLLPLRIDTVMANHEHHNETIINYTPQHDNNNNEPPFAMGDHVYQWFTYAAVVPFQHHAIVLDVWPNPHYQEDDDNTKQNRHKTSAWMLKIADFTRHPDAHHGDPDSPRVILNSAQKPSRQQQEPKRRPNGCLRVYESSAHEWKRVRYGANVFERHWFSSGTCTAAKADAAGLVRARVQFLLEHPESVPHYNTLQANCECVAVWCKTGTWATIQAASWLTLTALGQVKSAATVAGVAAATQITTPAAGLWGWMGYTTTTPLLTMQPLLIPAIAAYGAVTVAVPALMLQRSRAQWQALTEGLNEGFWEAALARPELFADCLTHWSEQE